VFNRTPPPATVEAPAPVPVEKKPMRDAEFLKPSTFASRRAQALPRPQGPTIVVLGKDKRLFKDKRNKDIWVDVELGVDWDNRRHYYYRTHPSEPWARTAPETDLSDKVERLEGLVPTRGKHPSSAYPPAQPSSSVLLTDLD
jgi:hypothetical protein